MKHIWMRKVLVTEKMLKHDGRIRRYLMERVKESVKNHLVAGEAPN